MSDLSALIARVEEGTEDKAVLAAAEAEARYDGYDGLVSLSKVARERYVERARAAITAYQAEAWQDISTAPKDGRLILIGGWEIYHPTEEPEWVESLVHWNGVCWDAEGAPVPLPNCSKWHPLPNPPASP